MALFAQQCKDVDVIVTTALVPGKRAPLLLTKASIDLMKPGGCVHVCVGTGCAMPACAGTCGVRPSQPASH